MSDEEAKAVQEVAKLGQKVTDATTGFGRFVERYTGSTLQQAMGIIHDKLAYMRWERQVRYMQRAEEFLRQRGLQSPTRRIPLNVAVPLLEAASLEENDGLQDTWARLLVNAVDADSGVDVTRTLVSILADFGPMEARCLEVIYETESEAIGQPIITERLPNAAATWHSGDEYAPPTPEMQAVLWNLARLGCVAPQVYMGGLGVAEIFITPLGKALVEACRLRTRPNDAAARTLGGG